MSNIDERVVKMEFDNKAFEKNANETMSTLDKLKELLNFDNVKGSFGKLTKAANKVDISNVSDGIETVNAKLSAMQVVGATAISNVTNSLINFGKKVVGGTFGQIISGGINRALNIEQAKFTIEGLGKDFVQLKEDINYAVAGTAYGFDEAAKAASMMAASGIEAGDQMKASLRGISGMAAMTGDSYSNIADIFGNIAGKGKLTLQEVNRFATRGINVAAKLAEQFGTTEEVVRDMVSSGEVDFQTFAQAMDDAFGEHATEANKTFTGAMSNIKASLSRVGAAFITPLIETNEKDAMLLETYKDLDRELVKIATDSNKAYENGVNARTALNNAVRESKNLSQLSNDEIKALIDGNRSGFYELLRQIPKFANLSNEELKEIYNRDQVELEKILSKTPEYAKKTREELQDILKTGEEQFIEQARQMDKYANLSDEDLSKMYKRYSGFQYNLVTVMQAFKRMLGVIEGAVSKSSFMQAFLNLTEKASKTLSYLFNAIAATFSTVEKKGKTFSQAIEIFGKKGHIVKASTLWERFGEMVGLTSADLENFKGTINGVLSIFKLFGNIIAGVWKAFSPLLGLFKTAVSIVTLVTGTVGRLVEAAYKVINSTKIIQNTATAINAILSGIVDTINFIVDGIVTALTFVTNNAATKGLVNMLESIASSVDFLFNGVFKVFGSIAGVVVFAVGTIIKQLSKIPNNPIFKLIVRTVEWIGKIITEIFGTIAHTAGQVISVFLYPFTKLGDVSKKTGSVIDSALSTINSLLNSFARFLKSCSEQLGDFIKKYIDFDKVLEAGNKAATLLRDGLDFDKLFGKSNKKSKKQNIFGGISDSISKSGGGVLGVLSAIGDAIKNAISKIDFKKIGKIVSDGLKFVSDVILISLGVLITILEGIGKALMSVDYIGIARSFGAAIMKLVGAMADIIISIPFFIAGAINEMIKQMPSLQVTADKLGEVLGNLLVAGARLVLKAIPLIIRVLWSALKVLATKMPGVIREFGYELNSVFGDAFTKIFERLKKISFKEVLQAINAGLFYKFLFEVLKLLKVIRQSVDILGSISRFFGGLNKAVRDIGKGIKQNLQAKAILMLAGALAIFVGLAIVLSKIPRDDLIAGGLALSIFAFILYEFAKHINKLGNLDMGMERILAQLSIFLVALTILIGITALVSKCETLGNGLAALLYIAVGLAAFTFAINKMKIDAGRFKNISKAFIALSAALLIIAIGLRVLATANPIKALAAAAALAIVLTWLTASAILVSKFASPEMMKAFALFGPAVLMISGGLALLSLFDFKTIMGSVLAIVAVLAALVGAAALVGNFAPIGAGLTVLSIAIAAFGASVLMIGTGVYLFIAALQTLAMMGKDGSIQSLGKAIQDISSYIPILFKGIGEGLLIMVQTLADGATIIADALLQILSAVLIRLMAAADMFATVGVHILLTLLHGILSAIGDITSTVIQIITTFTNEVSGHMGEIIDSGMNLMIEFINGMANGLNEHSEAIWAAVKNLVGEIINFLITGLQTVVKEIPFIGDDIAAGLDTAKGAIEDLFGDGTVSEEAAKEMGATADAVSNNTDAAQKNAKKNLDKIPKAAKKSAKSTGDAFNDVPSIIGDKIKEISEGADISEVMPALGEEQISAYQQALVDNADPKKGKEAGNKVKGGLEEPAYGAAGENAATGFNNGVKSPRMKREAYSAGYDLGGEALRGIKAKLREKSPSKETEQAGVYAGQGLVNGMAEMARKVYRSGSNLGRNALAGLRNSLSLASELESIDNTPTIRPVLDLSNVKMGLNNLDSMFGSNQYALGIAGSIGSSSGSINLASSRPMNVSATFNVNGTDDPRYWADEFVRELEIQARTYNG